MLEDWGLTKNALILNLGVSYVDVEVSSFILKHHDSRWIITIGYQKACNSSHTCKQTVIKFELDGKEFVFTCWEYLNGEWMPDIAVSINNSHKTYEHNITDRDDLVYRMNRILRPYRIDLWQV